MKCYYHEDVHEFVLINCYNIGSGVLEPDFNSLWEMTIKQIIIKDYMILTYN